MNQDTPNYAAWDIKPEMYPPNGDPKEQVSFILRYGVLAPSTHNSQPWRFTITAPNELRIDPDWSRALPHSDADNRGLFFSQGCCLQNILVAAEYFGWEVDYAIKGNDAKNGYIAVKFQPRPRAGGSDASRELFDAMATRQSHKLPFEAKTVAQDVFKSLESVRYGDARVAYTTDKNQMSKIIQLHMRTMLGYMKNKHFAKEVASWMRGSRTQRHDGMPGFTFGLGNSQSVFAKFMTGLTPKSIKVSAKKDQAVLQSGSAIGVVLTEADNFKSWIDAGLAYQRAGLLMAAQGIRLAPKAAAVESGDGAELAELFGSKLKAQLYFGMGYGDKIARHSPRRYILPRDNSESKQKEVQL